MQAQSIVTPFTPTHEREARRQMRHSVYLDTLAECLYETAVLCERVSERPPEWHQLPHSERSRYRFEAAGALNRLDPKRCHEAQLRAREHVATGHYDRDYSLLGGPEQRRVAFIVRTAVETYARVLEGLFQPLPAFRAEQLEPGEGE
jgi:hypothetical protein